MLPPTYYGLLDLTPVASVQEIRRAYREKSKLYHPDTTNLPAAIATEKFQQLNEAYATLSSPERRLLYDRQIGFSRLHVVQPSQSLHANRANAVRLSSAYLDPSDRPLSPGELFALFILGITFIGCLVLAIIIGLTRGELAFQASSLPQNIVQPTPAVLSDWQGSSPELQTSSESLQSQQVELPPIQSANPNPPESTASPTTDF
jgi:DnaJ-domain-containing protein 1